MTVGFIVSQTDECVHVVAMGEKETFTRMIGVNTGSEVLEEAKSRGRKSKHQLEQVGHGHELQRRTARSDMAVITRCAHCRRRLQSTASRPAQLPGC
jgi:hypothetical protein